MISSASTFVFEYNRKCYSLNIQTRMKIVRMPIGMLDAITTSRALFAELRTIFSLPSQ